MNEQHEKTVNKLTVNRSHKSGSGARQKRNRAQYSKPKPDTNRPTSTSSKPKSCKRCGRQHPPKSCPAWGRQCSKCNKPNHFADYCRTRTVEAVDTRSASETDYDDDGEELFIGDIGDNHDTDDEWWINFRIKQKKVPLKIDTGAKANLISEKQYKRVARNVPIRSTKNRLVTYSGQKIPAIGVCTLKVVHKGSHKKLDFYVVKEGQNILGLKSAVALNLIQRVYQVNTTTEDIVQQYSDVFHGTGCMPKEHHIQLKEGAEPSVHPPRRVPFALHDRLKEELDRLVNEEIIQKVDHPTDWVNSLVIVEKPNGKLRLCLDPKELNKAIKREHYQINTLEELMSKLDKAQYFSILDANNGFWTVPLDEESSELCCFNTPFGRYKFMRLPFGIHSASEVFHKRMSEIIENVDGCICYIDDLLIYGRTKEEHDQRLKQVLEQLSRNNIKLNKQKCKFAQTEIQYLGHVLTAQGIQIEKAKLQAILDMPTPNSRKDLERFLGMIQYIGRFIPSLSEISAPLRILLQKETEWHWEKQQQDAYEKLKDLATKAPTLKYYDVNKPVELSVDSSKDGMGAVLIQEGSPVAYASRALTEAEKGYAQIEKEMLAIKFGCQKFHQYIYGKEDVLVISDHKPLETITRKPLSTAPPRILRLLLAVQKYDINVKHKPGKSKEMVIADTLSRAYLPNDESNDLEKDLEVQVHMLISNLPISQPKLEEFKTATKEDQVLQSLKDTVLNGWPQTRNEVPNEIRPYWDFREEVHTSDDLLFKGEKLIVPKSMQREMMEKIHSSHLGINKCKARARDILYWPGMSSQIHDLCSKCPTCLENRKSNPKEPLKPHPAPKRAWSKVGTDLFHMGTKTYLIVVDYYSKFPEVVLLDNTTSQGVITAMKSIFSRHGIPDQVVSDGGPQYSSHKFKEFAAKWQFEHKMSSPRFPQSNGMAERNVQTVKNMLKKAIKSHQDPYLTLLEYRNTPIDPANNLGSPSQLLMSRRTKTTIPINPKMLEPKVEANVQVQLKQK